ncbi:MAG: VWA domain-containing protein [Myxococcota bacterium]
MIRQVTVGMAAAAALAGCSIENAFIPGKGRDTFYQEVVDEVDILFVVDDSASMAEEQAALAAGFSSFVEELQTANSNFHIGVISTSQDTDDPDRGILIGDPPYLTADDPDYVAAFQERVQIGIGGSDKEKGLEAAWYALSPEMLVLHNVGFLRPQANLLVVVVSDEDDCSDDGFLDGRDSTSCYQLHDLLTPVREEVYRIFDAKNNGELVQLGAIIGPFDGSCADAHDGRRYAQAALMTGGIIGKICDADWSNVLYDLGLNATGFIDTFVLSAAAAADSIEVTVDGQAVPGDPQNGWTYDPVYWTVHFNGTSVPPRGSEILVEYELAPSGSAEPPPSQTGTLSR